MTLILKYLKLFLHIFGRLMREELSKLSNRLKVERLRLVGDDFFSNENNRSPLNFVMKAHQAKMLRFFIRIVPHKMNFNPLADSQTFSVAVQRDFKMSNLIYNFICGQYYKALTIVMYISRVVNIDNLLVSTTLDP